MTEKLLFEALPEQPAPERSVGKARLLEPMRDQVELRSMDIDSLIGEDHPARLIWAYVEQLDLRELEDAIKAREGTPGHPAITRDCCWRCGFTQPVKGWEARGRWRGCARVTTPIVGCWAGYR